MPSPTFTLVQAYDTQRLTVSHFDLYRLTRESELDELGLEDALDHGAALIEWPERAKAACRRCPHLRLESDKARRAVLEGPARWKDPGTDLCLITGDF